MTDELIEKHNPTYKLNLIEQIKIKHPGPGLTDDEIISITELCKAHYSPQWISVKDRLPEKKVLATYKNMAGMNRIIVASYFKQFSVESSGESDNYDEYCEDRDAYYYVEGWYEQQDNWGEYASIYVNEGDVTHWMPLPEPPSNKQST